MENRKSKRRFSKRTIKMRRGKISVTLDGDGDIIIGIALNSLWEYDACYITGTPAQLRHLARTCEVAAAAKELEDAKL